MMMARVLINHEDQLGLPRWIEASRSSLSKAVRRDSFKPVYGGGSLAQQERRGQAGNASPTTTHHAAVLHADGANNEVGGIEGQSGGHQVNPGRGHLSVAHDGDSWQPQGNGAHVERGHGPEVPRAAATQKRRRHGEQGGLLLADKPQVKYREQPVRTAEKAGKQCMLADFWHPNLQGQPAQEQRSPAVAEDRVWQRPRMPLNEMQTCILRQRLKFMLY